VRRGPRRGLGQAGDEPEGRAGPPALLSRRPLHRVPVHRERPLRGGPPGRQADGDGPHRPGHGRPAPGRLRDRQRPRADRLAGRALHPRVRLVSRGPALGGGGGRLGPSPPDALCVAEYDWSPDGRRWVATAGPVPGDEGWYVSQLYSIDAVTGKATRMRAPATPISGPPRARAR